MKPALKLIRRRKDRVTATAVKKKVDELFKQYPDGISVAYIVVHDYRQGHDCRSLISPDCQLSEVLIPGVMADIIIQSD